MYAFLCIYCPVLVSDCLRRIVYCTTVPNMLPQGHVATTILSNVYNLVINDFFSLMTAHTGTDMDSCRQA